MPQRLERDEFGDRSFTAEGPFILDSHAETAGETENEVSAPKAVSQWDLSSGNGSETPYEVDPYVVIRPSLRSEHISLAPDDLAVILGREPALIALHRMLGSPEPQQAALAVLLGRAGRRSVSVNGSDMPVSVYLRLLSHLCNEAAGHTDEEVGQPAKRPTPIRDLAVGSKGPDVQAVQKALNVRAGAGLAVDGGFGARTHAAVLAFQRRSALKGDGIVGAQTRHALFPLVGIAVHVVGGFPSEVRSVAMGGGPRGNNAHPTQAMEGDPTSDFDWPLTPNQLPTDDLLQLLLKHLPSKDPLDGPLDTFRREDLNLDLPIPPLLTGPLLKIPGMQVISRQLQPGFQLNAPHLWQSRSGSPNPSGGLVLALQSVMALDKDAPGHLEISEGFQLGAPIFARTSDGKDWSVQWFAQATWVDPFWRKGRWHLVQPFAQINAQLDLKSGSPSVGGGLFPVNVTVDLVNDKLSLFGQGGIVAEWDFDAERLEVGAQVIGGLNVTFGAK